jgi:hypothetical protein
MIPTSCRRRSPRPDTRPQPPTTTRPAAPTPPPGTRSWRKADLQGHLLRLDGLSSILTSTSAYRQSICRVRAAAYVIRRIRGEDEPVIREARSAYDALVETIGALIQLLHWQDFELLVELIFARSGWQRLGRIGETQPDLDLDLVEPATGQRAFVQIKSTAGQNVLDEYVRRWRATDGYDQFFFVCHGPTAKLRAPAKPGLHVWAGVDVARRVVDAGMTAWVIERTR